MVDHRFGVRGSRRAEEFLSGAEASTLVLADGDSFMLYRRLRTTNASSTTTGNTGGMGRLLRARS
jgi:phosphoribosylamine-glycine ligase